MFPDRDQLSLKQPWTTSRQALYDLEEQSCLCTTSTDLAIQAEQHTKAVELPPRYREFAKVFSEEESFCFPPS